jgi:hypothetical protein
MGRLFMDALEDGGGDGGGHSARPRIAAILAATMVILVAAAAVGAWPFLSSQWTAARATPGQAARGAGVPGRAASPPSTSAAVPPPPPTSGVPLVPVAPVAVPRPPAGGGPAIQLNLPAPAAAAARPAATPTPAPVPAVTPAAAPSCASSSSRPSGTVTIQWPSSHHVVVTYNLTGLVPSCQFALGLFQTTCQSHGALLASFPAATSTAGGTDTQTITSVDALSGGVPARSSIRLGPPGSTDSASAETSVACADTQAAVNGSNPSYRTHVS